MMKLHTKLFTFCLLTLFSTHLLAQNRFVDKDKGDYLNCDQFDEDRVFLEAQSWWTKAKDNVGQDIDFDLNGQPTDDFGHIHIGTCFPLNETVSGRLKFKVLVILHNYAEPHTAANGVNINGTTLHYFNPHIFGYTGETRTNGNLKTAGVKATSGLTEQEELGSELIGSVKGAFLSSGGVIRNTVNGSNEIVDICNSEPGLISNNTCVFGYEIELDTRVTGVNGIQEVRFFGEIFEPDQQEMHISTSYRFNIQNVDDQGNPYPSVVDYTQGRGESLEGRGWYTGANYIGARIEDYDPNNPNDYNVPDDWAPRIVTKKGGTLGAVINKTTVHLNPRFHRLDANGNPDPDEGTIVFEHDGPIDQDIPLANYLVDLGSGKHDLLIKTEANCDLTNNTLEDDCKCSENRNATGGDNLCDTVAEQEPVFQQLDPATSELIDNDGQTLSAILKVPFYYTGDPAPTNPVISMEQSRILSEPNSGQQSYNILVSSDIPVREDVELVYRTVNGTAKNQTDYGYVSSDSIQVSILAGESTAEIPVRIKQDNTAESDEQFTLLLQDVNGANAVIGDNTTTITIPGIDATPVVSIQQELVTAEPNSGQTFYSIGVTSDIPVNEDVAISYRTVNMTARSSDSDFGYVSSNKHPITIPAGGTSATIMVRVKQDNVSEAEEQFNVLITGIEGSDATLGNDTTIITIEAN